MLDDAMESFEVLKAFCEEVGLVGIRPQSASIATVMNILKSNIDLGGILLYENFGAQSGKGISLARSIHALRPELPIFLRRDSVSSVSGLAERDAVMFRCAFTLFDLQHLKASLEDSIFSRVYPNELVRGVTEITHKALQSLFHDCEVEFETPYLVKDRIIYGEVFSLIAIDSSWCRGYMTLQASEESTMGLLCRAAGTDAESLSFREMNNVLGEATNLIWGSFKSRYVGEERQNGFALQTQVPIIIHHQRRFISFGSEDPQLCIKYSLREKHRSDATPVPIFQRFIFNLNWSPEDFQENCSVESFVATGELEMF